MTALAIFLLLLMKVLSVCCSLDWRLAYQLHGTAGPDTVTISPCPWASTNPEGHRPFVCFYLIVCVSIGLRDTRGSYLTFQGSLDKFASSHRLGEGGEEGM